MRKLNMRVHGQLFAGMFRAGMLGFGGGPSSIPLVYKEAVERYNWLTPDEYADILAIGNALPGPILTKLAGYIGYRQGGWLGLCAALAAVTMPTVIIMITLIGAFFSFRGSAAFQGMLAAVSPIVGVMLLQLTYSFVKQSAAGVGWKLTALLGAVSLIVYQVIGAHPAVLIAALLVWGLLGTKPIGAGKARAAAVGNDSGGDGGSSKSESG